LLYDDLAALKGTDEEIMASTRRIRDEIEQAVLDLVARLSI